jgi:hypothetical protein
VHNELDGSWKIDVRRDDQSLVWALWIRAAERIDVPDDDAVPGPLDIDVLPEPSAGGSPGLGPQWLRWWHRLLSVRDDPRAGIPEPAGAPELQAVAQRRRPEAEAWRRSAATSEAERDADRDATWQVIDEVTRSIGRRPRPFAIEIFTVPVRDDSVRTVGSNRYLVADRLVATPAWRARLDRMIREVA